MEWSVSDGTERYRVSLQDIEGGVSASVAPTEGRELAPGTVSVRPEGKPGRATVEAGGTARAAHIARSGDSWWIHIDGRAYEVRFHEQGSKGQGPDGGSLAAPMPGTVLELMVEQGQRVREGQALMVLEAMKMEHRISAPRAGEVTNLHYGEGDRVEMGSVLLEIGD